jgi:NADPH:quinone reductase-like Zn-dependent oxidoreductase
MKAAVVTAAGQVPVFTDFPEPIAAQGERLVQVTAAALSHLTRSRASGQHYSASGQFPFVAGVDGVGRLEDGQRVYFVLPRAPYGAMAERTVVRSKQIVPLPDYLDDVTAAVIANPGMSSWAALTQRARIAPGETVLINGATGASGKLAVRIARHLGAAKVIATGRNAAALESLGADETISLLGDEGGLEDCFRAAFAGGVNIVLDYLWGPSARSLLIAAARTLDDGVPMRFVQIGSVTAGEIALPSAVLRAAAIQIMGSGIGSVPLEGLIESISGVFHAAGSAGPSLPARTMALSDVATGWTAEENGARLVFTNDQGGE